MRPLLEITPPSERDYVIERFCETYPTFFFEWLTEIDGKRFLFEKYQIKYLLDDSMFRITAKGRQLGGSTILAADKFWRAAKKKSKRCDIVSVTLREAKDKITTIRNLHEALTPEWKAKIPLNTNNLQSIGFHFGRYECVINSSAASSGIRGGQKDVVFDEAGFIPNFEQHYVAALPAILRGNQRVDVLSTPYGKQGLYSDIWFNVEDKHDIWSRHKYLWIDFGGTCVDIEAANDKWVNEYKENYTWMPDLIAEFGTPRLKAFAASMSSDQFNQEFACAFLDDTLAYIPMELIMSCLVDDEQQHENDTSYVEKWFAKPDTNRNEVYIGIDFAEGIEGGDETSIQVVENDNGYIKHRAYWDLAKRNGFEGFEPQIQKINEIVANFRPTKIRVDETGLGRRISEELTKVHGSLIEPINFNYVSKEEMAQGVKYLLEKKKIGIQRENKGLISQINGIKRDIGPTGIAKYAADKKSKEHDDMFWALALAVKGIGRSTSLRIITSMGVV